MIGKALQQIVIQLNNYLDSKYVGAGNTDYRAEIKNIQKSSDPSVSDPGIKVALINVEEDKVFKNHLNPIPGRLPESIEQIHPLGGIPTNRINLYVLFAFNAQSGQSAAYLDSLTLLTHVLTYFTSTPYQEITIPEITLAPKSPEKIFNLEINYHNISLEDSNNMWSNLGGEQKPYAMYQIKMMEIEADHHIPVANSAVIQEANISSPKYDTGGNIISDTQQITHKNN